MCADSDSDTTAAHHYRVRVWNQDIDGDGSRLTPDAEEVSTSYSIQAEDEADAMAQALARFERDTGYREPDAHICFLAAWLDTRDCWGVVYGLPDDPDLDDPDDPSKGYFTTFRRRDSRSRGAKRHLLRTFVLTFTI